MIKVIESLHLDSKTHEICATRWTIEVFFADTKRLWSWKIVTPETSPRT